MARNVHDGHTGDLAYPPPQVFIAGGSDVATMLLDPLTDAVVGVGSFVGAGEPFDPRVLGNLEGDSILVPKLFKLGHDAVGDAGGALGVQTVHHTLDEVDLVSDGEVDEVGIDEDPVGWSELRVVLEEQGGRGFIAACRGRGGFQYREESDDGGARAREV